MLDFKSNMEIVQFIIGIIVTVSVKFIIIKMIYNRIRVSNLTGDDLKFDNIRPIYKQLKKGDAPKGDQLKKYTESLENRTLVYEALRKFNKTDLFPIELMTIEKFSESYLANWLNMNDDIDSLPDEINYKDKIELQNGVTFLIFKFKVNEPHLFANKGWMLGYVGYKTSKLDLNMKPEFIFSKFENEFIPENELEKITQ